MFGGWAARRNELLDLQRLATEELGSFLRQDGDSMWLVHVRVGWGKMTVLFLLRLSLKFPYLSHKVSGKGWGAGGERMGFTDDLLDVDRLF